MKKFMLLTLLMFSVPAFASHPHDRVCLGSAKVAGQEPIEFVFQYEIGRLYDHGGPNEDTHFLLFEASSCFGDDSSADCTTSKDDSETQAPGSKSLSVPVKLKTDKGEVFFEGKFDWSKKERLVGKINRGVGMPSETKDQMTKTTVVLNCISQPRLVLTPKMD